MNLAKKKKKYRVQHGYENANRDREFDWTIFPVDMLLVVSCILLCVRFFFLLFFLLPKSTWSIYCVTYCAGWLMHFDSSVNGTMKLMVKLFCSKEPHRVFPNECYSPRFLILSLYRALLILFVISVNIHCHRLTAYKCIVTSENQAIQKEIRKSQKRKTRSHIQPFNSC